MLCFFSRYPEPVAVKSRGHRWKPPDGVERQINGVEFDVRKRVQQHCATGIGLHAAPFQRRRRDQLRRGRSPREIERIDDLGGGAERDVHGQHAVVKTLRGMGLGRWIAFSQQRERSVPDAG